MPFGIRSAPEVFQRRMHELIEGMPDVEVVADDLLLLVTERPWNKRHKTMTRH